MFGDIAKAGSPNEPSRVTTAQPKQPPVPWHSWVLLLVTLAAGFALFYFNYGLAVKPWLRWGVTASWLALTSAFGIYDFAFHAAKPGSTDTTPIDRWTIAHTGAGIVFGVWYLPIWVVLLFTVLWEVFEWKIVGFGDKEIFKNRAVDVLVAIFGWWLVVSTAMGTTLLNPPFPLLHSVGR